MLELRGVGKRFAGVTALEGVSFSIAKGEVHALMGENGAGKSTLIKILTGQHTSYEGEITLDGQPVRLRGPRDAHDRFGIACIHQELSLVPYLSIAANIFLGREPRTRWRSLDEAKMNADAAKLLTRLGAHLDPRRIVSGLRTGEQQLVEIARALSLNARILLLDEPTSALADAEIGRLMDVVEGLRREGITIIYVSHKLDEVFRLSDRITVLRDGRYVGTFLKSEVDAPALIRHMAGRPVNEIVRREGKAHPSGDELLRVEGLSLLPDGKNDYRPLHDLSFSLRRGEVLGIAGLMGAGRTELLETIFGAHSSRHTRIRRLVMNGKERRPFRTPGEAIRGGFALVTEDRKLKSLVLTESVRRNATLASLKSFLRAGWVQEGAEMKVVQEEISRLRIKTRGSEIAVAALSGGNQQKVVIARCLLTNPSVLLLDEPTRGIDVGAKAEIYRLIGELAAEGMGVLLASSEIPELLALCDRILVLSEGRLTATLDAATATPESILEAATV